MSNTPEVSSGNRDKDFELAYGPNVVGLFLQRQMPCHSDEGWLKGAAAQLTDLVTEASGLDREVVQANLNQYWATIQQIGPTAYVEQLVAEADLYTAGVDTD